MAEEHGEPQIYLLLLRGTNFWSDSGLTATIMLGIPALLKSIVRGDSLDVPFVGFIRCQETNHSIEFEKGEHGPEYNQFPQAHSRPYHGASNVNQSVFDAWVPYTARWMRHNGSWRSPFVSHFGHHSPPAGPAPVLKRWKGHVKQPTPGSIYGHLPDHGHFSFVKRLDAATPQIAFGCTTQERFPLAVFFYRRKIGMGIDGIRAPYMVIGLRHAMISGWKQMTDTEEVELRYEKICWLSTSQLADTSLPQGASIRYWDRDRNAGGEAGANWATAVAGLTTALVATAGAIVKGKDQGS